MAKCINNGCTNTARFRGYCSQACKHSHASKIFDNPQLCGRCNQYFDSPVGYKTCPVCRNYNKWAKVRAAGESIEAKVACHECGAEFTPNAPNQVTCGHGCALARKRRKSREIMRGRYNEAGNEYVGEYIMSGCPWGSGQVRQVPYGGMM